LLEKQVTDRSVHATLADLADALQPSDVAFVYIGGHGTATADKYEFEYRLGSHHALARGEIIAANIWACPCPVFLVVDSCHSGTMLNDLMRHAHDHRDTILCPQLVAVASTESWCAAKTGWSLISMLHGHLLTDTPSPPQLVAKSIAAELRTSLEKQRPQYVIFQGGKVVEWSSARDVATASQQTATGTFTTIFF
jgi:hypothetical protein